ncbi:MAG: putative DNA binding domain-containing protein [Lachnospiraceae bacterium]|nr:putative DNA binding domain-containing protein [Lachnospiraceae bacterium]
MIDFNHLESYRENNRVEAKKALGGLPKSIWETYSAFANTLGGLILLGVEEYKDRSLHPVDLPDPEGMIREFWALVNDPRKASINILSSGDVYQAEAEGNHIIVINVPRADRTDKPVYIDGDPSNTYRRNGEGDYKCTREEYEAMVRDAAVKTQDMRLLEEMDTSVLNLNSLRDYRQQMKAARPGHVWEQLDDETFLQRIGAAGIGEDGKVHPTAAGLLMFGKEADIVREFRGYSLEFQEQAGSGNLYDFFFRTYGRLQLAVKAPFKKNSVTGAEDPPAHQALREALANCLVHADYYGRGGIVITEKPGLITMANPGIMRIEVDAAVNGGVSDPRNSTLLKMFNLIDVGERTGSGIPNIFRVWKEEGWAAPHYKESTEPDRTVLFLPLEKAESGENLRRKSSGRKPTIREQVKDSIIAYLTDHPEGKTVDIAAYVGLSSSRTRTYLKDLLDEGIIVIEGEGKKSRVYKLKR